MQTLKTSYRQWSGSSKTLFWLTICLTFFLVPLLLVSFWYGSVWAIPIIPEYAFEPVPIVVDHLQMGIFHFNIFIDTYLTEIFYNAGSLQWPDWLSWVHVLVSGWILMVILAKATRFERTPFLLVLGVAILLLATWRLDALVLFGAYNNYGLWISLGVIIFPSYLLHAFFRGLSPLVVWMILSVLWLAMVLVFVHYSSIKMPIEHLSAGMYLGSIIIVVLLILTIGHEIPVVFVSLITGGKGHNHLGNLLASSIIYVLILVSSYLVQTGKLGNNWFYVHPVFLVAFSGIAGLWGVWQRIKFYNWFKGYAPALPVIYLAVFSFSLLAVTVFYLRANDPVIEAIEDIVIYSHIGFGITFIFYIFSNFRVPLKANRAVHMVLYDPKAMPFGTFRFAGMIVVAGLFLYSGMVPWSQGRAGFYNAIAGAHYKAGENKEAETFYQISRQLEPAQHHGNYALGSIARQSGNDTEVYYFTQATRKNPLAQDYLALSQKYKEKGRFFDALFTLNEVPEELQDNGFMANNHGLLFGKTNILDSAWFFLEKAMSNRESREVAQSNIMAVFTRHSENQQVKVDSLITGLILSNAAQRLNYMAWYNKFQQRASVELPDSLTTMDDFYLIYNQQLNDLFHDSGLPDTSIGIGGMQGIQMQYLHAMHLYKNNYVDQAIKMLLSIPDASPSLINYKYRLLGLWLMEQKAYRQASVYFAEMLDSEQRKYLRAFALAMAEDTFQAVELLQNVNYDDESIKRLQILLTSGKESLSDTLQMARAYFMPSDFDTILAQTSVNAGFYDPILRKIDWLMEHYELESAKVWVTMLPEAYKQDYRFRLAIWNEDWESAAEFLPDNPQLRKLKAILTDSSGSEHLKQNIVELCSKNYFLEEAIMIAVDKLITIQENEAAYDIAREALQQNPYHPKIIESYVVAASVSGVENYAYNEINRKQLYLADRVVAEIKVTLDNLLEQQEDNWNL